MTKPKPLPPQEELKKIFAYSPSTGALRWRQDTQFTRKGFWPQQVRSGYRVLKYRKIRYFQHRIIWKMMTGALPEHGVRVIDHIDHDGTNNKWDNLQEISWGENCSRSPKHKGPAPYIPHPRKKLRPKIRVELSRHGTWRASIWLEEFKFMKGCGSYATREEAENAAPHPVIKAYLDKLYPP